MEDGFGMSAIEADALHKKSEMVQLEDHLAFARPERALEDQAQKRHATDQDQPESAEIAKQADVVIFASPVDSEHL